MKADRSTHLGASYNIPYCYRSGVTFISDRGLSYTKPHHSGTQRSDLRSENHSAMEVIRKSLRSHSAAERCSVIARIRYVRNEGFSYCLLLEAIRSLVNDSDF